MNKKGNAQLGQFLTAIVAIMVIGGIVVPLLNNVFDNLTGKNDLEKQINDLTYSNQQKQYSIDNLEDTIKSKESEIKKLNGQISDWETDYNNLNTDWLKKYEILNQSYSNLITLSNKQQNEIFDLKQEVEDLTNENLELQNKDFFNVIFKDENVYFEFWNIEIRKDTIVVVNIVFFFSIYLSFLFKLNLFKIRTILNINLEPETKKKIHHWVLKFNNFLTRLEKELSFIGFIIKLVIFFTMFISMYWVILKILSFV